MCTFRFSKDVDYIDKTLPHFIQDTLLFGAPLISTFVVIFYSVPIFMAVFVPLSIFFMLMQVRVQTQYMFPFTLNTITSVLSYSPHIAAPVRALRATAEASGLDLSLAHLQLLQRESCWSHLHPSVQLPRPVHVARRPPARPEPERVVHRLHVQQVLLLHCRLLQGCDSFLVCL